MQTLTNLYNIGSIFLYKILFIRSFIYSEINTFGLPKCSKISFAFNIVVHIPVQEMVYLKTTQKIAPMDVSVSGTIDQKNVSEKFRGRLSPLPLPGSAYVRINAFFSIVDQSQLMLALDQQCTTCVMRPSIMKFAAVHMLFEI